MAIEIWAADVEMAPEVTVAPFWREGQPILKCCDGGWWWWRWWLTGRL